MSCCCACAAASAFRAASLVSGVLAVLSPALLRSLRMSLRCLARARSSSVRCTRAACLLSESSVTLCCCSLAVRAARCSASRRYPDHKFARTAGVMRRRIVCATTAYRNVSPGLRPSLSSRAPSKQRPIGRALAAVATAVRVAAAVAPRRFRSHALSMPWSSRMPMTSASDIDGGSNVSAPGTGNSTMGALSTTIRIGSAGISP